jgi:DNA-binding transcriptional LysR family regulator
LDPEPTGREQTLQRKPAAGGTTWEQPTVDLRQLRYFVAVAEEQHFGRAAVRLRIAQPGLSQQIQRLERWIGTPLLVRDRRSVALTPAGVVLLSQARLVIEAAARAVQITREVARGKTAILKIGVYSASIYPALTLVLDAFGNRFPQVDIQLMPGHARQSLDALERHAIDVAVLFSPFDRPEGTRFRKLGSVEAMAALPADHPLAALERIPRSALFDEPFFIWPRELNPVLGDHLRATFFGDRVHDNLIDVADVTEMLIRVAHGEGITITNPSVVALDIKNLVFRRLEEPPPVFEYGFVWLDASASPFVGDLVALAPDDS